MSRLWILPVLGLIAVLGIACSDSGDNEPASVNSATPASSISSTSSASPIPSMTASPTPTVSSDWNTYVDPTGNYSFQYPTNWHLQASGIEVQTRVASFDLNNWNGDFAPDDVAIDIGRVAQEQLGTKPTQATDGQLAGQPAWTFESGPTGGGDASWSWEHWIGAVHAGYGYIVVAYFGNGNPDETEFQQILTSFRFGK